LSMLLYVVCMASDIHDYSARFRRASRSPHS
jgi:hypothetical protein